MRDWIILSRSTTATGLGPRGRHVNRSLFCRTPDSRERAWGGLRSKTSSRNDGRCERPSNSNVANQVRSVRILFCFWLCISPWDRSSFVCAMVLLRRFCALRTMSLESRSPLRHSRSVFRQHPLKLGAISSVSCISSPQHVTRSDLLAKSSNRDKR